MMRVGWYSLRPSLQKRVRALIYLRTGIYSHHNELGGISMYLLAIILPPVAVLFCGKPVQALLNFILTLFGWVPGVIHAILVVNNKKADKRSERQAVLIAKAMQQSKD